MTNFILECRDAERSENLGERAVIEGHLTEQVMLLDLQKSAGWAIVHPAHLDPQISWPSSDVSGMERYHMGLSVLVFCPSFLFIFLVSKLKVFFEKLTFLP